MKQVTILTFTLLFCAGLSAQKLENQLDSISYAIGLSLSKSFNAQGLGDVDADVVGAGIEAGLKGDNTWSVTAAEAWLQGAMQKIAEAKNEATKQEGLAFLAENGKRKGVVTTESGLQYEILTPGTGATPTASDQVKVHYTGTLLDGTKFDSSVDKGSPATFRVSGVIRGWTEVLQLMQEGAKYKVYVPYDLGYGCGPAPGGRIPFCSSLIFEVELLQVNP